MPKLPLSRSMMISWKAECYRSTATAELFQAQTFFLPLPFRGNVLKVAIAYILNSIRTIGIITYLRPRYIISINLPVVLLFICFVVGSVFKAKLLVDFHSGALSSPLWRRFTWIYRYICSRSLTICHNHDDAAVVRSWGGETFIIPCIPTHIERQLSSSLDFQTPYFMYSCTFSSDDPFEVALSVFSKYPNARFYVTGNYMKQGLKISDYAENVFFTGFLKYQDYLDLMQNCIAVITLSTRSHIMQMAAEEALSLNIPLVTNESVVLRTVFGQSAVYCSADFSDLLEKIDEAFKGHETMRVASLEAKSRAWSGINAELTSIQYALNARH